MNKKLEWVGGIWLLINIPLIPFMGSVFYLLPATLYLILAIAVLLVFAFIRKSFSVSVIASVCVVAIALLRIEQVQNFLQSGGVDSVTLSLILAVIFALIAVSVIVYKIVKVKRV